MCISNDSIHMNGMNGCQPLLDNYPLQSESDKIMKIDSFDVVCLWFDVTSVALANATGCSHSWI
jgi:hypothetical protein